MEPVVEAYWKTLHWSWHYFTQSTPINWGWVYPYADAPLVSDIVKYAETGVQKGKLNFTLSDQLHFIMPASSLKKLGGASSSQTNFIMKKHVILG
jgi:5'-3' exonuclease